jgi:hypothetical protein
MIKTMLYYKLGFIEKNVIEYYDEVFDNGSSAVNVLHFVLRLCTDVHVVGDFGYPV